MKEDTYLSPDELERIRGIDTCTLSNAIERFRVRLRNEGFVSGAVKCKFPTLPNIAGYAITARIRTFMPPMTGGWYYDRIDWFEHIRSAPEPRIIVVEDIDRVPGFGAFLGELHANIYRALRCVGYVTNGAIRDITAVETLNLQVYAANISLSHSYAHLVDFGEPVQIEGCRISPGDLVHGDRHGVQIVPKSIVPELPRIAGQILRWEEELVGLCQSDEFSIERLANKIMQARSQDQLDPVMP